MNRGLKESTEHPTTQSTGCENGGPLTQLLLRVPRAEDVLRPRENARLGISLEEPDSHQILGFLGGGVRDREHSPQCDHEWKEVSRPELGK